MKILDWIKAQFGKGTVLLEFTGTVDGKEVEGKATFPYIGEYDEEEFIRMFRARAFKDNNLIIRTTVIVDHFIER